MKLFRHIAAWCVGGLGLLGCWGQPAAAQAPVPGGAALREVTRLERVPEPPGGLIPYRVGKLWGYADTTGRLVIRPCFAWRDMEGFEGTLLFDEGYALVGSDMLPTWQTGSNPKQYSVGILNARGELLWISEEEEAVIQVDGSIKKVAYWPVNGREGRAIFDYGFQYNYGIPYFNEKWTGFSPNRLMPLRPAKAVEVEPLPPSERFYRQLLGANRGTWANKEITDRRRITQPPRKKQGFFALTTRDGKRLTRYRFGGIRNFSEGLATVSVLRKGSFYWGCIDTTGKMVV